MRKVGGSTKIKFIDVLEKFGDNQKNPGGFDEMLALRPVLYVCGSNGSERGIGGLRDFVWRETT
jgi:hypothetical protein